MNSLALRIVAVLVGVAVVAVALALYINKFLREPEPVVAPATASGRAEITLGTTPAVGSLGGRPTWVSYLARRGGGWDHTTTYSIQGVDPEGVFRAAIEQVRPDHGGRQSRWLSGSRKRGLPTSPPIFRPVSRCASTCRMSRHRLRSREQ